MLCVWLEDFALQVHRKMGASQRAAGSLLPAGSGLSRSAGFEAGLKTGALVLVDKDDPQGVILQACAQARDLSILPGMRYAQALSLVMDLCALTYDELAIERALGQIAKILQKFALDVDQFLSMDGVFWLQWRGMERYEPSIVDWAYKVMEALAAQGWSATVGTAFQKRSGLAVLMLRREFERVDAQISEPDLGTRHSSRFCGGASRRDEELAWAQALELKELAFKAQNLAKLQSLGMSTLGDLKAFHYGALAERFGTEFADWQSAVLPEEAFQNDVKVKRRELCRPLGAFVELDEPVRDLGLLQKHIESLLHQLRSQLVDSSLYASAIYLDFWMRPRWKNDFAHPPSSKKREKIGFAEPTRELARMIRLISLRLSQNPPEDPVQKIALKVRVDRAQKEQLPLLAVSSKRDFRLGDQALARIRAELGNDAVQRAELCEEHLPERSFYWRNYTKMQVGVVAKTRRAVLVRRLDHRARRVSAPRKRRWGPFSLRSDWWDKAIDRAYFFEEFNEDQIRWIYFDRIQGRWYQHGDVG